MIDNSNIYYKQVQLLLQLIPYVSEEECFALKGGNPDWSLLPFTDVQNLSSVKWKMINLEKMDNKKRDEAFEKLKVSLER